MFRNLLHGNVNLNWANLLATINHRLPNVFAFDGGKFKVACFFYVPNLHVYICFTIPTKKSRRHIRIRRWYTMRSSVRSSRVLSEVMSAKTADGRWGTATLADPCVCSFFLFIFLLYHSKILKTCRHVSYATFC